MNSKEAVKGLKSIKCGYMCTSVHEMAADHAIKCIEQDDDDCISSCQEVALLRKQVEASPSVSVEEINIKHICNNYDEFNKVFMPDDSEYSPLAQRVFDIISALLASPSVEEIATIISEAGFLRGFDEENDRFELAQTIKSLIEGGKE